MKRTYVWPDDHWTWQVPVTHKHGLRDGEMIFVGGEVDMDKECEIRHPGDIWAQTEGVLDNIDIILEGCEGDFNDIVKLVVFYENNGEVDEITLLEQIRARFTGEVAPVVVSVPLSVLAWPDLKIEIEAIAMRAPDGTRMKREASNPDEHWAWPFNHGIRCCEYIFTGTQMALDRDGNVREPNDRVAQAKINIENLDRVLAGFGADRADVCRINTFYLGIGTADDWARAGEVRGRAFEWPGPVGTGVPVVKLFPEGVTQRQESVAMLATDGTRLPRIALRPEGHWDWPSPINLQQVVKVGRMIFVGGQVSAEGQGVVLYPDDLEAQTHEIMRDIDKCLAEVGAKFDDIVKMNTFFKGGASFEHPIRYFTIRSSYFSDPGPTTTGVPLEKIAIEGLELEIEAYALVNE